MGIRQGWVDIMVLLNATLNIIILKALISDFDQIGYFSRGLQIAMLVVTASQAVLPLLFSRWAALESNQLSVHFEKVMRFVTTFSLMIIIGILMLARPLVVFMYGKAFLPAVAPMMILLPGTLLYLLSKVVIQFLGSRGLPEMSALMLLTGCVVNAALSWILIPRHGINGAAVASTAGNLTLLVLLMAVVVVKFKVHLLRCLCVTAQDCRNLVHRGVLS
jgi:O-antigen/teichoic acid export membrane protein